MSPAARLPPTLRLYVVLFLAKKKNTSLQNFEIKVTDDP